MPRESSSAEIAAKLPLFIFQDIRHDFYIRSSAIGQSGSISKNGIPRRLTNRIYRNKRPHLYDCDVSSLGFRGAVRALCHRRDASSRPTRHCDWVDAGFANGLATRRQLLHTIQYAAPLKLRQMPPKTLPAGR